VGRGLGAVLAIVCDAAATFTPEAKREATRDGAPAIGLIDGDHLCDLLKQLKLGVRTEMVERMTVEPG
jgi:restriction system protein